MMRTGDPLQVVGVARTGRDNLKAFSLRELDHPTIHPRHGGVVLLVAAMVVAWLTPVVHAQFTANYQTNVISGVNVNWNGDYWVGNLSCALHVDDGGELSDNSGYVAGSNSSAVVTGSGSVWSNGVNLVVGPMLFQTGCSGSVVGDSLVISNGGAVVDGSADVDAFVSVYVTGNNVVVTGAGSVWSNQATVSVGDYTPGNSVVVSDGGQVFANWTSVGGPVYYTGNNSVVVTGPGSAWMTGIAMIGEGSSSGNTLVISNGGMVAASSMTIQGSNSVTLSGGTLVVSNNLFTYAGSLLQGSGTIRANTDLAGVLSPGNSPGALTNFGNLTLRRTAVLQFELGGTSQGTGYDFLFVTNGVLTLNGLLEVGFINGFATNVLQSDIFTVLAASGGMTGGFADALNGERLMTEGGEGSFLVNYNQNCNNIGGYLTLSDYMAAEVPEPGTVCLCVVGLGCLGLARRRQGHRIGVDT
ncbi:MAG TPA: PEP-CTERM sorting domain-containing protein [Verrucomicrobiae bacterium]|nr:PEP-CTERM sorting domain-containing protein [Verrucomicrobiae bacterium]